MFLNAGSRARARLQGLWQTARGMTFSRFNVVIGGTTSFSSQTGLTVGSTIGAGRVELGQYAGASLPAYAAITLQGGGVVSNNYTITSSPTDHVYYKNLNGSAGHQFIVGTIVAGSFLGTSADFNSARGRTDTSFSYQTPSSSFSIAIGNSVYTLILDPAGTLSTGTVTLPSAPNNGQIVRIKSTQAITTLTISPNTGQAVKGAPTTIAAGGLIDAQFITASTTWFL